MTDEVTPSAAPFPDDALVYVDPDKRRVIGPVEWISEGKAKKLLRESLEEAEDDTPPPPPKTSGAAPEAKFASIKRRKRLSRALPWCTYRTAKRSYNVAGKYKDTENRKTLEEVIEKALQQAYWD